MKLFKRIIFAVKHDMAYEFVVIPYGETMAMCRFLKYDDAVRYTEECKAKEPMFEQPSVLKVLL